MTDAREAWAAVDRALTRAGEQIARAINPEDFQIAGLLCRESMISLAQAVFDPSKHATEDGVQSSSTDSKRMLGAFFACELSGGPNEEARRHAKAVIALADALVHRRTANHRDAALCLEAAQSAANIASIVTGRAAIGRASPNDSEPFRIPRLSDPALREIAKHYKQQGLETFLPRFEERDVRLAAGCRLAYYPGTNREVWAGYHSGRYEHILMIRATIRGA